MASERQKLLVAVDGSEQSREVVRYVAGICAPKRIEVTLFHVLSPVSENFYDLRAAPDSSTTEPHREWLARHQTTIKNFMDAARRMLSDSGFPDDAVRVVLQPRQEGIARDILYAQALDGNFGTIIVGRRGVSNVTTFPIGRVPMKLVQLMNEQTVWVVSC